MKSALILVFALSVLNQSEGLSVPGIGSAASSSGVLTKEQRCNMPRAPVLKRPYEVFLQKIVVVTANNDYIIFHSLKLTKYNRTTPVLNATFEITKEFPPEVETRVESYQLQGQRWDRSAVKLPSQKLCDFIATDVLFYKDLICQGNFASNCPIKPGQGYVYNYHLDTTNFPYDVPGGEDWRYNFITAIGDVIISEVAVTLKTEYADKNVG